MIFGYQYQTNALEVYLLVIALGCISSSSHFTLHFSLSLQRKCISKLSHQTSDNDVTICLENF